jgi:hypothetical protein
MWEKAIEYAVSSGAGLFAILFIVLLAWVLKTNNDREQRFIGTIEKLAASLACVEETKKDVEDIKNWLWKKEG